MGTSGRALGLNAQFMYLPNCMIISSIVSASLLPVSETYCAWHVAFRTSRLRYLRTLTVLIQDNTTQTTKVSIVAAPQGIDLGRMRDVHEVYLHVVHRIISLEEGMDRLEDITARGPKFKPWVRVLMCGCTNILFVPLHVFKHTESG